jgi:NAD(P)-dependent dehydrogenase (short-subunit alcohol dehydrogenase family)
MGAATARELARRGYHVLAGVRKERDADTIRGGGIEPVILDITEPGPIAAVAARVENDPEGRVLRALVNNAGIAVNAPVEALPMSDWRRQFEVLPDRVLDRVLAADLRPHYRAALAAGT